MKAFWIVLGVLLVIASCMVLVSFFAMYGKGVL
jgi:hypothetical protein